MTAPAPRGEHTLGAHRALSELLEARYGFFLREDMHFLVERRLASRVEKLGLESFCAYVEALKSGRQGEDELEWAAQRLIPRETSFFRDPGQLRAFEHEVVPRLEAASGGQRRLSIWSAGCASGEEAYSIAMLLLDRVSLNGWGISVLGTDLSSAALAVAERGEFAAHSLRATSPERRVRHFDALAGERHRVKPEVRACVSFRRLNLVDAGAVAQLPQFDVVFCRNVLMYFREAGRRRVVDGLRQRLRPGGFLFLGHAERLTAEAAAAGLRLVALDRCAAYERP